MQNTVVRLVDESIMSGEDDQAIRSLLCRCFPKDIDYFSRNRGWKQSYPAFTVMTFQHQRLVGHVSVVMRTIQIGSYAVPIAGIQNVCVDPECRGAGLLAPMIAEAMREAKLRSAQFGLLFCLPALEPVYQRCGWSSVSERAIIAQTDQGVVDCSRNSFAMYVALQGQPLPDGDINLNGSDW